VHFQPDARAQPLLQATLHRGLHLAFQGRRRRVGQAQQGKHGHRRHGWIRGQPGHVFHQGIEGLVADVEPRHCGGQRLAGHSGALANRPLEPLTGRRANGGVGRRPLRPAQGRNPLVSLTPALGAQSVAVGASHGRTTQHPGAVGASPAAELLSPCRGTRSVFTPLVQRRAQIGRLAPRDERWQARQQPQAECPLKPTRSCGGPHPASRKRPSCWTSACGAASGRSLPQRPDRALPAISPVW
jgi:hypothetical protein